MSHDFQVANTPCDHILRGIPCFISSIDGKTLLPRRDSSLYLYSSPVISGVSELKLYNQYYHTWTVVPQNDPNYGWTMGGFPFIPGHPELGQALMVQFNKRQNSLQGVWRLSYQVTANSCIKCNGSQVLNDITLLPDPDESYYVQFEAKLAQDFIKYLLTPLGSDPYHTWYGTNLVDLPGTKFNFADVESFITQEIQTAANNIKNLQQQQALIASQMVDPREMLDSISMITVQQSSTDARYLLVSISLQTAAQTITTVQLPLSN